MLNKYYFFLITFLFSFSANAHTFTGMLGFYDGLSHPVLGIDHFIAMVSVGVISAQIGGRAIWFVPLVFVLFMILGGITGMIAEINKGLDLQVVNLSESDSIIYIADYIFTLVEIGIILSVIFLGLSVCFQKKISKNIIIFFVAVFGFCHGTAHGLEMPWAVNPILFVIGFVSGTATLHLFGVGIGYYALKSIFSIALLRIIGLICSLYGTYLIIIF